MTIETLDDTRSFYDSGEFAEVVYIGAGVEILGIFDSNFDDTLEVNGERLGLRCVNPDIDNVAIGSTITIKTSGDVYTVRGKERGARTTLMLLEPVA